MTYGNMRKEPVIWRELGFCWVVVFVQGTDGEELEKIASGAPGGGLYGQIHQRI